VYGPEFGRMLDGHLDPEVISDLVGGLLTRDQAASLDRHFMTCAECRDMRDSLAQVRHLLGSLPAEQIPVAVAERIDLALAAEARRRDAAGEKPAGQPFGAEPAPKAGRRLSRRGARSLAEARAGRAHRLPAMARAAAAVAVVVTGGVLGFAIVDSIRSSVPETNATSSAPQEDRSLGAEAGSGAPPSSFALGQRAYTKNGLASEVRALLAAASPTASAKGRAAESPTATAKGPAAVPVPGVAQSDSVAGRQSYGGPLRPCVRAAAGRPGVPPIAVDLGTYQGRPAAVIVLPDAKDPARIEVYVVDSTCTTGRGRVLDSRQLPRR
jgi:hypothetical protein